jgi:hypothetical protein
MISEGIRYVNKFRTKLNTRREKNKRFVIKMSALFFGM